MRTSEMSVKRYNEKEKVRQQYDLVSPYYRELWGEHLHHGYWITGDESKEQAQLQLVERLADKAEVRPGLNILDVGCGFGASSIFLAKTHSAKTTGITISPVQVEMANALAAREGVDAKFLLMDAEAMKFDESFDVVWSVESISHYENKEKFFARAASLLSANGTVAVIDWFKRENLSPTAYKKFIHPIEHGMLVELRTMSDYEGWLKSNGLRIVAMENMNKNCAKTWDLCLGYLKNKALWELAARTGAEFVRFLKTFRAMRAGFATGNFVYGLLVAKKD
jgi:cyclopropane fatty-acyl-phospholipid synthase-like methyltransferase